MRAADALQAFNVAATTAFKFLEGGRYAVLCTAAFGGGSVKLQFLMPDGVTIVSVGASTDFTVASTAMLIVELPPGQYRFTVATATAVYATCARVPGE